MKLVLMLLLASTSHVSACSSNYIDPDGKEIYFFEECLHMERKFNDEIYKKCKLYSEQMRLQTRQFSRHVQNLA